jgi:hypothetical protein
MEKQKTIEPGIAIRLSAIPVMLLFALFWSIKTLIKFLIDYVRYGGEMIVYSKQSSRTTILDCFEKLREIQNERDNTPVDSCETCKYKDDPEDSRPCDYCTVINLCWEPKETDKK